MSIPKRRLFAPFWDSPPPERPAGHINPKTIWNNSIPAPLWPFRGSVWHFPALFCRFPVPSRHQQSRQCFPVPSRHQQSRQCFPVPSRHPQRHQCFPVPSRHQQSRQCFPAPTPAPEAPEAPEAPAAAGWFPVWPKERRGPSASRQNLASKSEGWR